MLILDRDRALDRMIWLSGRHALVVPVEFSHDHAIAAEAVAPSASDPAWRWNDAAAARRGASDAQRVRLEVSRSAA